MLVKGALIERVKIMAMENKEDKIQHYLIHEDMESKQDKSEGFDSCDQPSNFA